MILTPQVYWRLQWLCHRTPCEVSTMGMMSMGPRGLLIEDLLLVKQSVTPASVQLDMVWWADRQVELYETRGVEPWQVGAWLHTHPKGVDGPSSIDEETMRQSFGQSSSIVMLILTKDGRFYGRVDFNHDFGQGVRERLSLPCQVQVDWLHAGGPSIDAKTLEAWETEFKALVREHSEQWWYGLGETGLPSRKAPGKGKTLTQTRNGPADTHFKRKERDGHGIDCEWQGIEPIDDTGDGVEEFWLDPCDGWLRDESLSQPGG